MGSLIIFSKIIVSTTVPRIFCFSNAAAVACQRKTSFNLVPHGFGRFSTAKSCLTEITIKPTLFWFLNRGYLESSIRAGLGGHARLSLPSGNEILLPEERRMKHGRNTMATSKVYFSDLRSSMKRNLLTKLGELLDKAGLEDIISSRDLVALKLHFGEKGNTAFIRPVFIRHIVDHLQSLGAFPFLTDANTLYAGTRGNSVSHLKTAIENGFAYSVVNAPVIIADGLRGAAYASVPIKQKHVETAYIGREIVDADALISIAHFKGHELSGFGGAIKNVGMGCAARKGKLQQHSDLSPKVKAKKCIGCGECVAHCSQEAISLADEKKAVINPHKCVGCGECILICPNGAIDIQWSNDIAIFQEKMAEYTLAALKNKAQKSLFVNFITQVSPACDCYGHNDAPIVPDIGIVASTDPVAVDQASVDLVNRHVPAEGSCVSGRVKTGEDKFRAVYPKIDWGIQLDHAEKIGLGSRKYELISV